MTIYFLTDFINYDPAYSICQAVRNQIKGVKYAGHNPVLLAKKGFDDNSFGVEFETIIQGKTDNVVNIFPNTDTEIRAIKNNLEFWIGNGDVVITNDLIYQPAQWKMHVACRRIAEQKPNIKWLHFVHSSTDMNTAAQTGEYAHELSGKFPNSMLAVFHREELQRKAGMYGYEVDECVIIPNAYDMTEYYHPLSREIIEDNQLWNADIIALYPCRLDRGKQPHVVLEIFEHLNKLGYRAPVIIGDFHSTGGDKAQYREELRKYKVPAIFISDYSDYHVPHKVILDLFGYADILVHPSRNESDPLILPEAMWARCGLVLNFDLPMMREKATIAWGKFSSNIDINTGGNGATETSYSNRNEYMRGIANQIVYHMSHNPVLGGHVGVRQQRSIPAVSRHLMAAIGALQNESSLEIFS